MIEILRTRRSIRKFTEQNIEEEKLEILKEAVLRSPSAKNTRSCEYVFIDDAKILHKLSTCRPHGAESLQTAKLAVAVVVNERKSKAWIEDCTIAAFTTQLTAQSLGLGSCWVQIRGREYSEEKLSESFVRETLNIPETFRVLCLLAIGYPVGKQEGRELDELNFEKIKVNSF